MGKPVPGNGVKTGISQQCVAIFFYSDDNFYAKYISPDQN
jgi:hypothetical protein